MRGIASAIVAAIIIAALYFGREVFVPIALAILLSFVLAPLVRLLQRWHIPRALSVISVVLVAFATIFALGGVIATQVTELADCGRGFKVEQLKEKPHPSLCQAGAGRLGCAPRAV
jgi:predicted PurR-regulated permease PerM